MRRNLMVHTGIQYEGWRDATLDEVKAWLAERGYEVKPKAKLSAIQQAERDPRQLSLGCGCCGESDDGADIVTEAP